jgi:toxin ParE1/3/4
MAARRVIERVRESVTHLSDHPDLGRPGRVPGTRELIIPGMPFIIPYRLRDEVIEILTILHAARRWPEGF